MNILVVCRQKGDGISPFVREQVESLQRLGVTCEVMPITGNGAAGYATSALRLKQRVRQGHFDLIHAHYGLSGLLVRATRRIPAVITFHGSDLNRASIRPFSRLAAGRAASVILVAESLRRYLPERRNVHVIACGVDCESFHPQAMREARDRLEIATDEPVVLFASSFATPVKDFPLARQALDLLDKSMGSLQVLELRGLSRSQVCTTLNAASVVLLTSKTEGSPQIIKEALACDRPIVAVDVGDVRRLLEGVPNAHVVPRRPEAIARAMQIVLTTPNESGGRARAQEYSLDRVAQRILRVYSEAQHFPS